MDKRTDGIEKKYNTQVEMELCANDEHAIAKIYKFKIWNRRRS